MIVDLVQTTTGDGFRLDGVLQRTEFAETEPAQPRAVLCLHGVGGNFYGSHLLENISTQLSQVGWNVLRANTRGHDAYSIAQTASRQRHQGAAYETVDDCRLDIAGWVSFLQERQYQQILLLGHSLGAVKAIYAQAYEPQPAIAGLIAISPPRLSCQAFQNDRQSDRFRETLSAAEAHLEAGRPEELLHSQVPVPLLISAAGFIDKYGPAERYNFLRFAPRVRCPLLFTFGSLELQHGGAAFTGLPADIAALEDSAEATAWQPDVKVIEGADHHYRKTEQALGTELVGWLEAQYGSVDES